jgi:hypothetical protein
VRRHVKLAIGSLVFGTAMGIAGVAVAGSAYGSFGYYGPQAGYSYKNQNSVLTGSGSPQGFVNAITQDNSNAPGGYMGGLSRLYTNGALCASGDTMYNSGAQPSLQVVVGHDCGTGAYHAEGTTYAWTGSGYNSYSSFPSPDQNN